MPKPIVWINPNKQDLTTGHKTFDRQTKAILSGQVIGDTQHSSGVRSWNEAKNPVGQDVKPGAMHLFDMRSFPRMPERIRGWIKTNAQDQGLMVHEFCSWNGQRKIIHGYIIVRANKILTAFCTTGRAKSYMILDAVAPYIADMEEGEDVPYFYHWR